MSEMTPDDHIDSDDAPDQEAVVEDVDEMMDTSYSPPESYRGEGFGTTAQEALEGENLEQRLAQEVPEPDPYAEQPESVGGEVGSERAGRLVAPDEGLGEDTDAELVGDDVGIDGAAASSEEAAVHVVADESSEDASADAVDDPAADAMVEAAEDDLAEHVDPETDAGVEIVDDQA